MKKVKNQKKLFWHIQVDLKGAQVWDFDVLDFYDFFIMKSI